MKIDKKQYLQIFCTEAEEYLSTIEKGLVALEQNPNQVGLLDDLARAAHTLKGSARMMGYDLIRDTAHKIEDTFQLIKSGQVKFKGQTADAVFSDLDKIKNLLKEISAESGIKQEKPEEKKTAPKPKQKQEPQEKQDLEEKTAVPAEENTGEEYIRIPISRVNGLLNLIGELVINKVKSTHKIELTKRMSRKTAAIEKMIYDTENMVKESLNIPDELIQQKGLLLRASQEMEKAMGVLNHLHHTQAQFSTLKTELIDFFDDVQTESFQLNPVITELQSKMKEIKMLPCSMIFETFPRMLRDIAHEQDKLVQMTINGSETELDKKVLESIKGPLMHVLRNAIDHGIEPKKTRLEKKKSETGLITLSAFQEGDKVIIEVSDDGQGIDIEEVKTSALNKELVTEKDLKEMSEEEILGLVYTKGFSTSKFITDISGRGIGLDVVLKTVEDLKGTISIRSEKDKGTTFRMELPLTVAVMRVMLVKAGDIRWAFEISSIEESIKEKWENVATIENRMAIQVRGKSIPIVPLVDILGIHKKTQQPAGKKGGNEDFNVVVMNSINKKVGFIVDKTEGEEEVFVKNIGSHLNKVVGVSGATVLPSGEVIVILNPQELVRQAVSADPVVREKKKAIQKKIKKKILVVEDSLTTRELEKAILENSGYEVDTAIDGVDALDKISKDTFDLIISDIQMPRMDGFELCKKIRENKKLKDLPVIFVTALSKDEEKRRGIEVGAQAYITKSQFDQTNLLDTIERIV